MARSKGPEIVRARRKKEKIPKKGGKNVIKSYSFLGLSPWTPNRALPLDSTGPQLVSHTVRLARVAR